MNLYVTVRIALRALAANTLRSILTMLGIIIGVASVITISYPAQRLAAKARPVSSIYVSIAASQAPLERMRRCSATEEMSMSAAAAAIAQVILSETPRAT